MGKKNAGDLTVTARNMEKSGEKWDIRKILLKLDSDDKSIVLYECDPPTDK